MEHGKAEANLVIDIQSKQRRCAVLPRITPVGQPVTSIEINLSDQRRP